MLNIFSLMSLKLAQYKFLYLLLYYIILYSTHVISFDANFSLTQGTMMNFIFAIRHTTRNPTTTTTIFLYNYLYPVKKNNIYAIR